MANDVDNGSLSFEALAVDDIKRWADVMPLVEEAVAALRTAQSGEEIAAATQVLHIATARARDYESAAIDTMKTYGYSDGVKVPGVGIFRVRWLDDGMRVLEEISELLPPNSISKSVATGDGDSRRDNTLTTPNKTTEYQHLGEPEPALIQGQLKDVNPDLGTAELHAYVKSRVPLCFDASMKDKMLRLETKFVKVRGHGWISDEDEWIVINVEEITIPRTRTIEEIRNDPNPKIFDPNTIPRASEPFDVDDFLRVIYEGRGRTWKG